MGHPFDQGYQSPPNSALTIYNYKKFFHSKSYQSGTSVLHRQLLLELLIFAQHDPTFIRNRKALLQELQCRKGHESNLIGLPAKYGIRTTKGLPPFGSVLSFTMSTIALASSRDIYRSVHTIIPNVKGISKACQCIDEYRLDHFKLSSSPLNFFIQLSNNAAASCSSCHRHCLNFSRRT